MSSVKGRGLIKPLTLTPFWHRRVCEAIILIDTIIVALFAWVNLGGLADKGDSFGIDILTISLAVVSLAIAGWSYFWSNDKHWMILTISAYLLQLAAIITLVTETGASDSPFIALWMLAAIFSGIFGVQTVISLGGFIVILGGVSYFQHTLTSDLLLTMILAGIIPLLASIVLWHSKSKGDKVKDQSYADLKIELNEASDKADIVINAISEGVIAINNSGVIELINPTAQRMVGWANQDALKLDYKSVLHLTTGDGKELEKSTDPIFSVLATNQPKRKSDLYVQTNAGKRTPIDLLVSPIGSLGSGAIIVFRDITKQQAEEKAQADFISTASHEMRTPVASIEGYLGLALNANVSKIDEKARDFITKAHESAQHLGRLFQDLLDITKADDGRLKNDPKVIELVTFIKDIAGGLQQKADEKGLRLFINPAVEKGGERNLEPIYYVNLDRDHLREVIANLVENAIKYTPAGEIVVAIKGDADSVLISIQDSGIGIPAEDLPHMFQKFYRVDNSETREIGGTGLGLYLCKRLVETMDGRIWVESEYKKGSTFFVELPRISHIEAQRLIEEAAAAPKDIKIVNNKTITLGENENGELLGTTMSARDRDEILNTPIILTKGSKSAAKPKPIPVEAITEDKDDGANTSSDMLVGSKPTDEPPEKALSKNPMVLPMKMQSVESNLQTAAKLAAPAEPKPAAAPQPAPAPVPQPETATAPTPATVEAKPAPVTAPAATQTQTAPATPQPTAAPTPSPVTVTAPAAPTPQPVNPVATPAATIPTPAATQPVAPAAMTPPVQPAQTPAVTQPVAVVAPVPPAPVPQPIPVAPTVAPSGPVRGPWTRPIAKQQDTGRAEQIDIPER